MDSNVLKGNWKQFKGNVKKQWAKLTDDEINQIEGDYDLLSGKLQEKYGFQKDESREKINDFIKRMKN